MQKNKPWDKPRPGRRPEKTRERPRVLIVCEDSKSSADYLRSFPIDPRRIELKVVGTGMNTDSLVEEAIRLASESSPRYSHIWCVFDRDSFPPEQYNRAFQLADSHGIRIAWANEAFELWYLLHFNYFDSAIGRDAYEQKLLDRGLKYDKSDKTVYETLKPRQGIARKHAERLERHWNDCGKNFPQSENPSTSVHKLVAFLNELAELKDEDEIGDGDSEAQT